ncbi:MAG: hypothetical protein DVB25_04985 [Verrucomicrobia bacterium]|nr:MAG: hypothetical protein DVB25_04985 [Verrucomicrobiota bacterium]
MNPKIQHQVIVPNINIVTSRISEARIIVRTPGTPRHILETLECDLGVLHTTLTRFISSDNPGVRGAEFEAFEDAEESLNDFRDELAQIIP